MIAEDIDIDEVWRWLEEVPDPEIPAISVVDLGIVRDLRALGGHLHVTVTPTYSGCPATAVIEMDIERHLRAKGIAELTITRRLSPPWTTDWLTEPGRAKLRAYGIAPPVEGATAGDVRAARAARLAGRGTLVVLCPRCGSNATEEVSRFGSTPCKAAWRCTDCLEPFDYFKCL